MRESALECCSIRYRCGHAHAHAIPPPILNRQRRKLEEVHCPFCRPLAHARATRACDADLLLPTYRIQRAGGLWYYGPLGDGDGWSRYAEDGYELYGPEIPALASRI